ncbi:phosphatase PAP2 family protein [Paenibacillus sacheonensis]|uniref:Phosphatase PAP2 family protein n=1 Tax=Paenibacillus sacheonensis TaxID=742054 RepID=A0A7X4YS17_9BACL|nr:phosphatase PAP2 family protein [Paenibacillus sacheonensis]MBM7566890.1 undecaprenyl-diphosphatase [Paenibacillus sacheonensis]NBC71512.1 phosphatase PAP2 family protein [Paenibacillus sacheonensis]
MINMVFWVIAQEQRIFFWANRRPPHRAVNVWLSRWLGTMTHMGGASFTLLTALACALAAPGAWSTAGWQCAAAVTVSHIPVAVVKRKFSRLRPYQALAEVHTCRKPLRDSSFPSGHTTAVFAWLTPWLLIDSALLPLLLPIAVLIGGSVAWSRMYLGLHYPSDVTVGAVLGSLSSVLVSAAWSLI